MVDIIIPTIDDPKYLDRALQSIKDTCQIDQIAVYVINDASNYDSQLYEKVIKKYSEIKIGYKALPISIGPGPARNEGIKMGTGDWICFLDCDDIYIDNVVEYCDDNYDYFISQIENPDNIFYTTSCEALIAGIHGMGIKRSYLEQYNLYFPNIKYGSEDTIFRFCACLCSKKKKLYPNEKYYKYVIRPDSNFTHRKSRNSQLNDAIIQDYRSQINWLASLSNHLLNINIDSNIINSQYWNQNFLQGICLMADINHSHSQSNPNPRLYHLIFLFFAYLCKKYINLDSLNLSKVPHTSFLLLVFIKDFFILDNDILIFKTDHKLQSYLYFFKRFQSLLPSFITEYYNQTISEYYDIPSLIKIWTQYYYKDFFVY